MNLTEEDFDALRDDLNEANKKLAMYKNRIGNTFEMFDFLCKMNERESKKIPEELLNLIVSALAPLAIFYSEPEIDAYPHLKKQFLSSIDVFEQFIDKLHK